MSTLLGVGWIWWLLGTIGIGGTVALAVFAPAVFTMVAQAIARLVGYLLSTRWGCALLAAIVAVVVADVHRSMRDQAEWAERTAEFNRQQEERDRRIADQTRAEVEKEIAAAKVDDKVIDTAVKDVIGEFRHVEPVPALGNPFRVGDDACRLRAIVGQAGCEPQGRHQSVPTPRRRPNRAGDHS